MEDNKQVTPEPQTDFGEVNKAIANLSLRVAELEKGAQISVAGSGDGTDLRPVMLETLMGLKALRTALITSASELDERLRELAESKEENSKLKYQIKHLKRSLEVEERYGLISHVYPIRCMIDYENAKMGKRKARKLSEHLNKHRNDETVDAANLLHN